MSKFSIIWDTEVKALANACITEPEMVRIMCMGVSYEPTDKEKEYLEEVSKKGYRDNAGMYYISSMIFKVEHALADGREALARMAILEVYRTLISESYFENVFDGNDSSEEWKSREALRDGLFKLLEI